MATVLCVSMKLLLLAQDGSHWNGTLAMQTGSQEELLRGKGCKPKPHLQRAQT